MSALTLQNSPGFADVDSATLAQDQPAFGLKMQQISDNAAFGMVSLEIFEGFYHHGDVVPLPVSGVDGYIYSRAECLYLWHVACSTNPQSNWITGPDSLWFTNWNVDQATGDVFSEEWYRRSGAHMQQQKSNDGILQVFTIAQRRRDSLTMASSAVYSAITGSWIATDKPLSQQLAPGAERRCQVCDGFDRSVLYGRVRQRRHRAPRSLADRRAHLLIRRDQVPLLLALDDGRLAVRAAADHELSLHLGRRRWHRAARAVPRFDQRIDGRSLGLGRFHL
jgi:hypothetical protein